MNDDITAVLDSGGLDPPDNTHNNINRTSTTRRYISASLDGILQDVTVNYLNSLDPDNPPLPSQIRAELLGEMRHEIKLHNACVDKEDRFPLPKVICAPSIADILIRCHSVKHILYSEDDELENTNIFGYYSNSGSHLGVYVTSETQIARLSRLYNYSIKKAELNDIYQNLAERAPRVYRCDNPNLVPVNNGIFDYKAKQLLDFSPEYVFTAKSKVNYNPSAQNIVIHNDVDGTDWDIESWMSSLSDDPEIVNLLWEILGAVLRCNVKWDVGAFFMSSLGNNGKGTLCELLRGLCGKGSYVTLPLSEFSKEFSMSTLVRANAIITDENDFLYLDKVARIKAVITSDPIYVNRKQMVPITLRFKGFMVQCLNDESPRFKDKTNSLYRRILPVPFTKCFTGKERKYIKGDYVHRQEVLEYVVFKVLNMNYDVLSFPTACRMLLDDIMLNNDFVSQFLEDVLPQCKWNLVPYEFLYQLYCTYLKKWNPSGTPEGFYSFNKRVRELLHNSPDWDAKKVPVKTGTKMDAPEPLIVKYQLEEWYNPLYKGPDVDKLAHPPLKYEYRGIVRK